VTDVPTDRPMRRVSVMGSSGSGKTTFAILLSSRLGVPHIALDAINWGPNWSPLDDETFRARVREATAGDGWVCDGNYSAVRPIVHERADTVVWLDLPLRTCLARMLRRTARRVSSREELWGVNRESWREAFVGRDALFWWLITQHGRKRREYAARLAAADPEKLRVVRLASSAEADRWLSGLERVEVTRFRAPT
jgi:adenylate kinase family enzyme